jgi:hypothetical protein
MQELMKMQEYPGRLQIMEYSEGFEKYEQLTIAPMGAEPLAMSKKRILPATPFPRKYVHSVFADLQDAKQAAQTLRGAGFGERDIYVLESGDFVEAVLRSQSPLGFLTSMDDDLYMREASRGHSFLAVRPANFAQLKPICDLLALHNARLVRYIDTWTVAELLP